MHDRPILADQPVEKGRLADVGTTDDRNRQVGVVGIGDHRRRSVDLGISHLGEQIDDRVQQVPDPVAVNRTHGQGFAQPQRHQLPDLVLEPLVVDLVGNHDGRPAPSPHELRDLGIVAGDTGGCVDDQQHDVGLGDRALTLPAHLGVEIAVGRRDPTPGVDH